MFAKTIVLSDAFLDMPLSARCLYFTLGMFADDDGFVNSPKGIMRQCGASADDLKLLLTKKFVLAFESGVIVIKHWRINNYLRGDRYHETKHIDEKSQLEIDENGAYKSTNDTLGIPSIGKPRLDKVSIDKNSIDNISMCEIDDFFESVWKLYPLKKGKSKVSMTTKKKLYAIGYDKLSKAIQKYVDYVESVDWLHYQNGVTFFNGTYNDYLDNEEVAEVPEDNGQAYTDDYWQ